MNSLIKALKNRKSFKKGGLLVSVGVAPVSEKQITKLKKTLTKRKKMRSGGSAKRNYRQEYDNYQGKSEQKKNRAGRNAARRMMIKEGRAQKGDGKDVHHKDNNPNNNSPSNLSLRSKSYNRARKAEGGTMNDEIKEIVVTARKRDPVVLDLMKKHLPRFNTNKNSLHNLLNVFVPFVLNTESSGRYHIERGANPYSSASGGYQFLEGSVEPALNRVEKYMGKLPFSEELRAHKDTSKLSPEAQDLLFLGDLFEKKGSDKYMQGVLDGGREEMLKAYYNLHHTAPDEKTKAVAERELDKVLKAIQQNEKRI